MCHSGVKRINSTKFIAAKKIRAKSSLLEVVKLCKWFWDASESEQYQPINDMGRDGQACVAQSLGILRLMSPPLTVGANIESGSKWGPRGNLPRSCGTLWLRPSPHHQADNIKRQTNQIYWSTHGTGAQCKITGNFMNGLSPSLAPDSINSALTFGEFAITFAPS